MTRSSAHRFATWFAVAATLAASGCVGVISADGPSGSAAAGSSGASSTETSTGSVPGGSLDFQGGSTPGASGDASSGSPDASVGPTTPTNNAPPCEADALPARRIVRLSDRHFANAVRELFKDPALVFSFQAPGSSAEGFFDDTSKVPVGDAFASQLQLAAEQLSDLAAQRVATMFPCPASTTTATTCVRTWLQDFVGRAYRRPLLAEEVDDYVSLFLAGASSGASGGLRLVVQGVVQAPSFLYRTELGANATGAQVALTNHELAAQLSFWLTESPPDAELWSAANAGTLSNAQTLRAQVTRLLALQRTRDNLTQAFMRWSGVSTLNQKTKDATLFPQFANARASLQESSRLFIAEVLWGASKDVGALFSSRTGFVDAASAPYFGVAAPTGTGFQKVTLPLERAGILTQPGFLARYATETSGQLIQRGAFVAKEALCLPLSAPPPQLDIVGPGKGLTEREFATYRANTPTCAGCHSRIDPFGLAMTGFNAVGKYQPTTSSGALVDTTSTVVATDFNGPLTGAADLGQRMSTSALTATCTVTHMLSLGITRTANPRSCATEALTRTFVANGRGLEPLIVDIAVSDSFRVRQN